jgi:hypothetical protein
MKVLGRKDLEPNLSCARVDAVDVLWRDFFKAMGVRRMVKCYGWTAPPTTTRVGETVYTFHDAMEKGLVGWTSLCPSPKDATAVELTIGIFPMHQGRGLRRHLLEATVRVAFNELGADEVTMLVFDSAKAHQDICMRESVERGSYWVYAGEVWYPEPLKMFVLTQQAWHAHHKRLKKIRPA